MLQDIQPHRLNIEFRPRPAGEGDYVVALRGERVLLVGDGERENIPMYGDVRSLGGDIGGRLRYLFSLDDAAFHLLPDAPEETERFRFRDASVFRTYRPSHLAFAGATAFHLASWYAKNRHCGGCGAATAHRGSERALECPSCGIITYPRISPAVIVGVRDGDRLLLTRYANRPASARRSLVAGFLEIGETLEDAVRREVLEEAGVRVRNIRYYKSQPWAFSGSVLAGFFADLDGPPPDIVFDAVELQEALWVARGDIPPSESDVSLTAEMIELFRRGEA